MEQLLKQLIDGQQQLTQEIRGLSDGQQELRKDVADLKTGQQELRQDVAALRLDVSILKSKVSSIEQDVTSLKTKVSSIEQDMGTLAQQNENTDLIKAILHNQEISNVRLEVLTLSTATREHVERTEGKLDDLNTRLFNQAGEINYLKTVAISL